MKNNRYSRQSFLGHDADERIAQCTIGIVGLGGGGSHIVQQTAHIGFRRFVLYDADVVEDSNLNRLVGAELTDVEAATPKIDVATRIIRRLQPDADIQPFRSRWQDDPKALRQCQIVFGGVDTYQGRAELEVACRRYLMHYIDIGMDVHGKEPPVIGGQVILSSPNGPCMRCLGFLTEEKLAEEAARYGHAGGRPQVIWPNGVLASTAVGLAVNLVTNWTRRARHYAYLVYDGNQSTVTESLSLRNRQFAACPHFPATEIGDPVLIDL